MATTDASARAGAGRLPVHDRVTGGSRFGCVLLSDTGSESAGGGAAASLLAGYGRVASSGRIELPRGALAVALGAFRAKDGSRAGAVGDMRLPQSGSGVCRALAHLDIVDGHSTGNS